MKYRTFFASFFAVTASFLLVTPHASAQAPGKKHPPKKVTKVATPREHLRSDTVAVVNDVVITYGDFKAIMSGYLKAFVTRSHNNVVSDSLYTVIVDSSWIKAVSDILIEREIQKRMLSMTEQEVREAVTKNPPDFLRAQFTDSLGKYHPEYLRQSLSDPRNDSIVRVLLAGEQLRLETERLVASIAAESHAADRQQAFDAWLKKTMASSRIVDRRTTFGFY